MPKALKKDGQAGKRTSCKNDHKDVIESYVPDESAQPISPDKDKSDESDHLEELERLAELEERDEISKEDYEEKKKEILGPDQD